MIYIVNYLIYIFKFNFYINQNIKNNNKIILVPRHTFTPLDIYTLADLKWDKK